MKPKIGFPWGESYNRLGFLVQGYGFIIQAAGLPAGASILEPGCGTGSLTEFLVRAGYRVDAVDVSKDGCAVTEKRIAHFNEYRTGCRVICNDLASFLDGNNKKYDAVIFSASFHHLMDHL